MASQLARVVVAGRWFVVAGWIALAVAAYLYLPNVDKAPATSLGALVPSHSRSAETERRALRLFRAPLLSQVALVQRDPNGLSQKTQKRAVRADLWARLRDSRLYVPALREPQEDIPELLSLFVARAARKAASGCL